MTDSMWPLYLKAFGLEHYISIKDTIAKIDAPNWEPQGQYVHDWEAYIPDEIREIWDTRMGWGEKFIAFCFAERLARREEWE